GHIAAHGGAGRQERDSHSTGLQGQRDGEVRQIENFELLSRGAWVLLLGGAAEVVGRSHHHVSNLGGHHISHPSGPDKLIEENVRNWADEPQIAFSLPDDLVASSKRNHLLHLKPQSNAGAIRNKFRDRLLHADNFGHARKLTEYCYFLLGL